MWWVPFLPSLRFSVSPGAGLARRALPGRPNGGLGPGGGGGGTFPGRRRSVRRCRPGLEERDLGGGEKRLLERGRRAPDGSLLCTLARQSPACPTRARSPSEAVSVRRVPAAAARVARRACDRLPAARLTSDPARVCARACPPGCVPSPSALQERTRTAGSPREKWRRVCPSATLLPSPAPPRIFCRLEKKKINKRGESPPVRESVRSRVRFGGMTVHLTPRNQVHSQQVCSDCRLASFLLAELEHAPDSLKAQVSLLCRYVYCFC